MGTSHIGSPAVRRSRSDTLYTGLIPAEVQVINLDDDPKLLQVVAFEATRNGFVAEFSQPLDTSVLNVATDMSVIGQTVGDVYGSLLIDPSLKKVTFLTTGGTLAPDNYTVTLTSGASAFRDTAGQVLDGNADGTVGDHFVRTFAIGLLAEGSVVVSLPDLTRGYGQPVNVPPNDLTAGLPLRLSNGHGVTGVDLQLHYDPSLLEIQGFRLATAVEAVADSQISYPAPGVVILTITGGSSLAATDGPLVVGSFTARVPSNAPYAAKHLLDIRELSVYDDAAEPQELPAVEDDAIHVAAFAGDTNGNGRYNAPDATLVQPVGRRADGRLRDVQADRCRVVGRRHGQQPDPSRRRVQAFGN